MNLLTVFLVAFVLLYLYETCILASFFQVSDDISVTVFLGCQCPQEPSTAVQIRCESPRKTWCQQGTIDFYWILMCEETNKKYLVTFYFFRTKKINHFLQQNLTKSYRFCSCFQNWALLVKNKTLIRIWNVYW